MAGGVTSLRVALQLAALAALCISSCTVCAKKARGCGCITVFALRSQLSPHCACVLGLSRFRASFAGNLFVGGPDAQQCSSRARSIQC